MLDHLDGKSHTGLTEAGYSDSGFVAGLCEAGKQLAL
jgi:hypothetical protein